MRQTSEVKPRFPEYLMPNEVAGILKLCRNDSDILLLRIPNIMRQFSAAAFFWCGRALRSIRSDCYVGSVGVINGEAGFKLAKDIDSQAREKAISHLTFVVKEFRNIGLTITADTAQEVITELQSGSRRMFEWLITQTDTIEKLAEKELEGKFFLYIPPERARFWPTAKSQNVFGNEVHSKFPSSDFDIGNAGVCLATMMATASVFHLMRTLEVGLRALGKALGVSVEHTNWQNAIEQIEKRIREIPKDPNWKTKADWKDQQQYFSDCAAHFSILKDAWRNHAMHGRASYTEDQAEVIFLTVKAFMQKLAQRLHE